MAVELATGYVSIVPSARNFGRTLGRDISGPLTRAGDSAGASASTAFGSRFTASMAAIGKRAALALGVGVTAAAGFGIKLAADFQQTTIAFEGILGSAEAAKTLLGDLRDFAAQTPFEFPGLADAAKNLLAVGFATEDIIPTMTTLGNVAATLGVGETEIQGVVRALGQMKGKGKASAEELQQISEQIPGFSAIKAIAEGMGISVEKAFEQVAKGAVPADDAIGFILDGMESFPGAAGAMERQSKTLNGVLSTFKDTIGNIAIDFITPYLPAISRAIQSFADNIGSFFYTLKTGFTEDEGTRIEGIALFIRDAFEVLTTAGGVVAKLITERLAPAIGGLVKDGLENLSTWWDNNGDNVGNFFEDLGRIFQDVLSPAVESVGNFIKDTLAPAFIGLGEWIIENELLDDILFGIAAAMAAYAGAAIVAAIASNLALLPFYLLLAVVVLLAAAAYYAYTNWGWFRDAIDKAVDFASLQWLSKLNGVVRTFVDIVGDAIQAWKDLQDLLSVEFKLPIPGGGGFYGDDIPLVPFFDNGGVMPGRLGVHRLAWVAGGETVVPTHKDPDALARMGGSGGDTFNIFNPAPEPSAITIAREQRRRQLLAAS